MDSVQKQFFLKKSPKHICIDGAHGTNQYDFYLIDLLTLDDLNEEFPYAFLIRNREDGDIVRIFFQK